MILAQRVILLFEFDSIDKRIEDMRAILFERLRTDIVERHTTKNRIAHIDDFIGPEDADNRLLLLNDFVGVGPFLSDKIEELLKDEE